jgi:hypothetical protein
MIINTLTVRNTGIGLTTIYRGRIYIHVSKKIDRRVDSADSRDLEHCKTQRGMIIGSVELYAIDWDIKTKWDEYDLFHWRLKKPLPLEKAIPARGALGLWEYTGTIR